MKFLNNEFLKKVLFTDLWGKVISICLAFLLWYYVTVLSLARTHITLPVYLINVPKDVKVTSTTDLYVQVEIMAREDISPIIDNARAVIDMSQPIVGTSAYSIQLENFPSNLNLNFTPKKKEIQVEEINKKTVPIVASFKNNIYIQSYTASPSNITLSGVDRVLGEISNISLPELSIVKKDTQNIFNTNLTVQAPIGTSIDSVSNINLTVNFKQGFLTNNIQLPLRVLDLKKQYTLKELPEIALSIMAQNTNNFQEDLENSEIILSADLIRSPGGYTLPITIRTPSNLMVIDPPGSVTVEVTTKD